MVEYGEAMTSLDAPVPGSVCCLCSVAARLQCRNCLGVPVFCQSCAVQYHRLQPFHHMEVRSQFVSGLLLLICVSNPFFLGQRPRSVRKGLSCRPWAGRTHRPSWPRAL
jgi:hypothetical protein